MILESKYQLTSQRQFVDAFFQTKSYASTASMQSHGHGRSRGNLDLSTQEQEFRN